MAWTRPHNAPDTSYRRSTLASKNDHMRHQLELGDQQRLDKESLRKEKLEKLTLERERKARYRAEARQMDIEYGLLEPKVVEQQAGPRAMPEWKQNKLFLESIFGKTKKSICIYKEQNVYRTRMSMQEYLYRQVTDEEWQINVDFLAELRQKYDSRQAVDAPSTVDGVGTDTAEATENSGALEAEEDDHSEEAPAESSEFISS